jgi:hypothetical protein
MNKGIIGLLIVLLVCNVETMKVLLTSNNFKPMEVAHWSGERRGLNTKGTINSFELAQALSDALHNDKLHSMS